MITITEDAPITMTVKEIPFPKIMKHTNSGAKFYFLANGGEGFVVDLNGSTLPTKVNNTLGFQDFYGEVKFTQVQEFIQS